MNFLAPMAFWLALVLPVVVVFYILKRRRTVHLVPSTLLWDRFLAEHQANAPFQKLRRNWLLLLQLLMLAALIFALSRPYFSGEVRQSGLKILIIDASASMQSRDGAPTRFEQARQQALEWVEGLEGDAQMILLQAAADPRVLQPATGDRTKLRRALNRIAVTDEATHMKAALELAESLIRDRRDAEIHLFSDGAFPALEGLDTPDLPLVYHQIGESARNAGIVSVDVRPDPEDPSRRTVFAKVANFMEEPLETEVELYFNDRLLDLQSLALEASADVPVTFSVNQPENGIFRVRLTHQDELAVDNEAFLVSRLPEPVRVALVTEGNRFLERALRNAHDVELLVTSDYPGSLKEVDVVVLDHVVPTQWPDEHVLAIRTAPDDWFQETDVLETPPIIDWDKGHELMRFVELSNVQVSEALRVGVPSWAQGIVETTQSPLMLAGQRGRQRIVWIGFDLLESTWPLRVSFPIFVSNAVRWLSPGADGSGQWMVEAGEPFRFPLDEETREVRVTSPQGEMERVSIDPSKGELVYSRTSQRGVYRFTLDSGEEPAREERAFAVNAIDPEESDITPQSELEIGAFDPVAATERRQANLEIWRWIVLLALGVLLGEWWYYHRRTV